MSEINSGSCRGPSKRWNFPKQQVIEQSTLFGWVSNGGGLANEEMLWQAKGRQQAASWDTIQGSTPKAGKEQKVPNQDLHDNLLGGSKIVSLSEVCA